MEKENKKTIAIMIKFHEDSENIDDKTAELFVKQLDYIRAKFNADSATISISTYNPCLENDVLNSIAKHLTEKVNFGLHFYSKGTYDYKTKEVKFIKNFFNEHTLQTFLDYYVGNKSLENQWFAYIGTGIGDIYQSFQEENYPMLEIVHSRSKNNEHRNLMYYPTTTKSFSGIVEGLANYIEQIKDLSPSEILESQKNMVRHLSKFDIETKVKNNEFAFLDWYFHEGYLDEEGYNSFLSATIFYRSNQEKITEEELVHLKNILNLLQNRFAEENDLERIRIVENAWKC